METTSFIAWFKSLDASIKYKTAAKFTFLRFSLDSDVKNQRYFDTNNINTLDEHETYYFKSIASLSNYFYHYKEYGFNDIVVSSLIKSSLESCDLKKGYTEYIKADSLGYEANQLHEFLLFTYREDDRLYDYGFVRYRGENIEDISLFGWYIKSNAVKAFKIFAENHAQLLALN